MSNTESCHGRIACRAPLMEGGLTVRWADRDAAGASRGGGQLQAGFRWISLLFVCFPLFSIDFYQFRQESSVKSQVSSVIRYLETRLGLALAMQRDSGFALAMNAV